MREGRERAEALVIAAYKGKATRVNIHNMMMLAEAEVEAEAAEAEAAKRRQAASEEATPQVGAVTTTVRSMRCDSASSGKCPYCGYRPGGGGPCSEGENARDGGADEAASSPPGVRLTDTNRGFVLALRGHVVEAAQNAALAEAQRDLLQAKQVNKEQKRALHHLKKSDTETVTENSRWLPHRGFCTVVHGAERGCPGRLKEELQDLQSRLNMSPQPSTIAPSEVISDDTAACRVNESVCGRTRITADSMWPISSRAIAAWTRA